MASLYRRAGSPFWWIKKNVNGKIVRESLGLRPNDPKENKQARAICAGQTSKELGSSASTKAQQWDHWVTKFIDSHCSNELTRVGYKNSWEWLRAYLDDVGVKYPRELTYDHAYRFIAWREATDVQRSTALRDIKVLRVLMRHAVRTGMATSNPCDRLGIERPVAKMKAELSDEQIRAIYDHLATQDPWMSLAFAICVETGCRISEANIETLQIDRKRKTLTFPNPKGGRKRAFTTFLSAQLEVIIAEAVKKHPRKTLVPPKTASQLFSKVFRRLKIKGSIHCTRVTFISRLARSGVHERVARLAVNHASEAVHRAYQRLGVEDVRQIEGVLKFPPPVAAGGTKTENQAGSPSEQTEESQAALQF